MKVVDAVWEKRNLGLDVIEFIIESNDDESVVAEIIQSEKQYNVLKIPASKPELADKVQEHGYRFVETMFFLKNDLRTIKMDSAKHIRIFDVELLPMNEQDIKFLNDELYKGLFNTDRIYLDSHFSKEAAAERYKNWINDECARGANLYKMVYREKEAGFFILKDEGNNVFHPFLLGLYDEFKSKGFGITLIYSILKECMNQGAKQVIGSVSSNNSSMLKVDLMLGYEIKNIDYVFVKHKGRNIAK